jgi:hypothetical protein
MQCQTVNTARSRYQRADVTFATCPVGSPPRSAADGAATPWTLHDGIARQNADSQQPTIDAGNQPIGCHRRQSLNGSRPGYGRDGASGAEQFSEPCNQTTKFAIRALPSLRPMNAKSLPDLLQAATRCASAEVLLPALSETCSPSPQGSAALALCLLRKAPQGQSAEVL